MEYKDNIKYVHLQVEKQDKNIIYTIHDLCGTLKVSKSKEDIKHYLYMQNEVYNNNLKIVDIIHINYNCNYANIPLF